MQTPKISHQVNDIRVQQRFADGYINLNQMAKANGKRIDNWLRLQETKDLIAEFDSQQDLASSDLREEDKILAIKTISGSHSGTWAHPDIAIQFAQWCNPAFALQVSRWVREWMTTGGNPDWQENRALLKQSNSKLMDAVKAYIDRHPELSDNAKKWAFTNVMRKAALIHRADISE